MHVANGAQVAFQHPGLEIETMRIGAAVRLFQAHGELPALAGPDVRRRVFLVRVGAQINAFGRLNLRRQGAFHGEDETLPVCMLMRQFGNDALHLNVLTLPIVGQAYGQTLFGSPGRVIEATPHGQQCDQQIAQQAQAQIVLGDEQHGGQRQQQPGPGEIRQHRLLLQQPDAEGKAERKDHHAPRLAHG